MHRNFYILPMVLIIGACGQPNDSGDPFSSRDGDWQAAMNAGDADGIAALYADNARLLPPNGEATLGHDAIKETFGDMIDAGLTAELNVVETQSSGDLAYNVGTYSLMSDGGVVDQGKYVETWRRSADGVWLMTNDIWNSNLPAAVAEGSANRVVVIARVADTAKWEQGFRTHGDLLGSMSLSKSHYAMNSDSNRIAVYNEPASLDQFMSVMESQATADAMEFDGIDRDTVDVFVLDKVFEY